MYPLGVFVCRCHLVFLWRYSTFFFCFVPFSSFLLSLNTRPFVQSSFNMHAPRVWALFSFFFFSFFLRRCTKIIAVSFSFWYCNAEYVTVPLQSSFLLISDHNIVTAHVKLHGYFAHNRPAMRRAKGLLPIDRRRLINDPDLRQ